MKVAGRFATTASLAALRALDTRPEQVCAVPAITDFVSTTDGGFTAVFTPATPFGRQPIESRVIVERADGNGALLRVHGRRGPHVIDVELAVSWEEGAGLTAVAWEAEVAVRGPAASVAQRVAGDVARRAIGDLLGSVAAAVEEEAGTA